MPGFTYGVFDVSRSRTFKFCKEHALLVKLIPLSEVSSTYRDELQLMIRGSSQNNEYQDSITLGSKSGRIWFEVYTAPLEVLLPQTGGRKFPESKLRVIFDHGGHGGKCYLVFTTLSNCQCSICETWWTRFKIYKFRDTAATYGLIAIDSSSFSSSLSAGSELNTTLEMTFAICANHVMEMKLIEWIYERDVTRDDFKFTVKGSNREPVFTDWTLDGSNLMRIRVQVSDPSKEPLSTLSPPAYSPSTSSSPHSPLLWSKPLSSPSSSSLPPTSNILKLTFHGSKNCVLVFNSRKYCPCQRCKAWTYFETIPFRDSPFVRYGTIALKQNPVNREFELCENHKMDMKLVPRSDLDTMVLRDHLSGAAMEIKGQIRNITYRESVQVEDEICHILLEVLPSFDKPTTRAHEDSTFEFK
ncbi:hypothetical protein BGZ83_006847 [Gryganskiella cystojenkinii]|nr:hypothetical protein BGZ83_006847 [Gryganskiella cystojenkinii]